MSWIFSSYIDCAKITVLSLRVYVSNSYT